ncbi:MAG: Smr/MutS family protein [Gemmatimonadota bacterium]|nr:Smr/MutS family protein [Gemmatimonadota bacterium]
MDRTLLTLDYSAALDVVAGYASGPLGGARTRSRLPSLDPEWIRGEMALVAEGLVLLRAGDGLEITPVPEIGRALDRLRIEGSVLDGHDLVVIRAALAAARLVAREIRRVAPRAPRIGLLEVPVADRRIEQRLEQSVDPDGELLDGASPGLARARREVHAARERLVRKLESVLRSLDAQAAPSGAAVTVRGGRYVIPVRRDSRFRPQGIVHDESGSAGTLFIEPTEAIDLGNALREALADESREVLRVLRELTEMLRPELETIRAGHGMCVEADDLAARARYAHAVAGEVPAIEPAGGGLVVRNGRHPLLLARGAEVVPFDLVLEPGERTLLISGPNAGGKTVLLKAVGLFTAMVQAGVVPPLGPDSRLPVFTRFFADIGDNQSIAADLSTFSAHLATLRGVLAEADESTLVLLDELGSGTDPSEGAALAWATLETLTRRRTLTLATTHLGALKTLASHVPGVVNGSLEFDAATLSPSYRFQKGVPGRSYGLAIARRLGVDPEVLARAEAKVPEGERALDRLLHEVEARDQQLRSQETALAGRVEETSRQAEALAHRLEDVRVREQELRRRERDAEQRARAQSRDYLLTARRQVEEAVRVALLARSEEEAREARRLVEEAIQSASARPQPAADGSPDRRVLRPAQRVRLGTGGTAKIESIRDDGKVLVTAGSIRMVVPADAIVEVIPDPTAPQGGRARPGRSGGSAVDGSGFDQAAFDVDLRGMRVDEAESAVVAALDAAILADNPFLRIIHGKGTGAIRALVHELLQADRRVRRFALAPANQGGSGVTVAEFRA